MSQDDAAANEITPSMKLIAAAVDVYCCLRCFKYILISFSKCLRDT